MRFAYGRIIIIETNKFPARGKAEFFRRQARPTAEVEDLHLGFIFVQECSRLTAAG